MVKIYSIYLLLADTEFLLLYTLRYIYVHGTQNYKHADKRYAEIKGLMEKLFQKLDSLTSYEFTPKIVSH